MSAELQTVFLALVRLGIGTSSVVNVPGGMEWGKLKALADRQGLSAIVLDGLNEAGGTGLVVKGENIPSQLFVLQWIGEVMQSYEGRYAAYEKAIGLLAGFYNQHGFRMMVLKGYACSLDWPDPKHRPCGDIDIWQFGRQREADAMLNEEKGVVIDASHHHHTVFDWQGFMVENHYDFVNVYAHKSSRELEKVFKELGQDDSHWVEVNGEKVYLPSANLHALFLIRHMVSHFAAAEITIRQVLDWAFFVEKHGVDVDWPWLETLMGKYHTRDFLDLINAICVEDLGFSSEIFPPAQFAPDLKDKVLNDILEPRFTAAEPRGLFRRLAYKYRRWQGNAWKQELCYSESRWEMFWTGIWAKILRPESI